MPQPLDTKSLRTLKKLELNEWVCAIVTSYPTVWQACIAGTASASRVRTSGAHGARREWLQPAARGWVAPERASARAHIRLCCQSGEAARWPFMRGILPPGCVQFPASDLVLTVLMAAPPQMRTVLYGKKAANLYTQAFVQNTQARALYQESEDTYYRANDAASYDDWRRARHQWDYFYNRH